AIIMNNDYAKYVIKKDIIKGRALKLTLLLKGKIRFTIIAIYNFSNNSYKDEILKFYMKLEEILTAEKKLKAKIVCIGDFNANFKKNIMIDINLIYHDKPLNTWNRSDKKSRIDYIWVIEDIVPNTIYASTNKVHIFETNHLAVTVYFQIDDLFHTKQLFKKKKHNNNNLKVDYKKIDNQLWETYEKKIGKLLDKEKDIIDNVKISINNINRIWNTIRDTFKKANNELPKKKGNPNKEVLPKTIVFYKRFLHKLSYILTNLTEKKIMNIDGLLDKNIKEFKKIVKIAFKLVQVNFAEESKIYKDEKMKFYIQRRCEDLQDNKKRFLDSTLNRKRSKIVLDKIVIEKNSVKQLILDEELIENKLIEHFKSFAGKKLNSNETLKGRWIRQYSPKQDINEYWYNELANDKAPGISQISNEMLKHMGTLMKSATLKLANLCLQ
ncbi:4672_t:CDS:2, partial [Rhizophagus irregularis]